MTEEDIRSLEQEDFVFSAYYNALHKDDFNIQDKIDNSIAFKAIYDLDTIYYY